MLHNNYSTYGAVTQKAAEYKGCIHNSLVLGLRVNGNILAAQQTKLSATCYVVQTFLLQEGHDKQVRIRNKTLVAAHMYSHMRIVL